MTLSSITRNSVTQQDLEMSSATDVRAGRAEAARSTCFARELTRPSEARGAAVAMRRAMPVNLRGAARASRQVVLGLSGAREAFLARRARACPSAA